MSWLVILFILYNSEVQQSKINISLKLDVEEGTFLIPGQPMDIVISTKAKELV